MVARIHAIRMNIRATSRRLIRPLACLLCLLGIGGAAQSASTYVPITPDPILESWRWHALPELKGLGLLDILERGEDDFWFATRDGLYHYDGRLWDKHVLEAEKGPLPQTLALGHDGRVLVGTTDGIYWIEKDRGHRLLPRMNDLQWDVYSIEVDAGGGIWAATNLGLLFVDGSMEMSPRLYTSAGLTTFIRQVAPDAGIVLEAIDPALIPTRNWSDGIGLQTRSAWVFQVAPGSSSQDAGIVVGDRILTVDGRPGDVATRIIGKPGDELDLKILRSASPDTARLTLRLDSVQGTYLDFALHSVVESSDGDIWIGAIDGDVLRYRPESGDWRRFTETDGLPAGKEPQFQEGADWSSTAILRDRSGNTSTGTGCSTIWKRSEEPTSTPLFFARSPALSGSAATKARSTPTTTVVGGSTNPTTHPSSEPASATSSRPAMTT